MGYVYIAASPGIPDLVKIGSTDVGVESRISSLSNTSVPERFELVGSYAVTNAYTVEQTVHSELKAFRYKGNQGFFRLSKDVSVLLVKCICEREELRLSKHNIPHPLNMTTPVENPRDLGNALCVARHTEGISQNTAANMSHLLQKTISAIEAGKESTELGAIYKLLKAYNLGLTVYSKGILPARCALP